MRPLLRIAGSGRRLRGLVCDVFRGRACFFCAFQPKTAFKEVVLVDHGILLTVVGSDVDPDLENDPNSA